MWGPALKVLSEGRGSRTSPSTISPLRGVGTRESQNDGGNVTSGLTLTYTLH